MAKSETASSTKDSEEDSDSWIRHQLSESDPSPVQFKRLKPRLGSQFQSRVPKNVSEDFSSSRPLPELMSAEEPFLTEKEAKIGEKRRLDPSKNAPAGDHGQGYGPNHDRPSTKRGGLCIHRGSSADTSSTHDFALYCQRLMLPPDDHVFVTEESWKQEMIQQYGTNQSGRRSNNVKNTKRAGRKGVKRKLSEKNDQGWGATAQSSDEDVPAELLNNSSSQQSGQMTLLEDVPHMLEYLHVRHHDDVQTAQLSVLVDFSAGRASKARKCLRKHLHSERFKRPPVASSQSWRQRFERTFPAMVGDMRTDPSQSPLYPFGSSDNVGQSAIDAVGSEMDVASEASMSMLSESSEDMKGVWRSVLSYGQSFERTMGADCSRSNRPYLSDVMSFVRNAYALPTPELSFGTRHIVVEQISLCLHSILDHVSNARDVQAKLMDKLYDEKREGIDLDALKKFLDESDRALPVKLDESKQLCEQLEVAEQWQARLDAIVGSNDDGIMAENLSAAEQLMSEGKAHGMRSKNLALLEKKIERAYRLRNRIMEWNQSTGQGKKESIKFIASMVREANRMDVGFPEMTEMLSLHRSVEEWIDRASIAIRSRMSLSEVESLIDKGQELPVDLSEFLEKLRSRVCQAHEWIYNFQNVVPCPYLPSTPADGDGKVDNLAWLARMRKALFDVEDGTCSVLLDMASEGSRIPVEIDCVKMLQLEIDAKSWSIKGKKWMPARGDTTNGDSTTGKKGKLEDLRDHYAKGVALRERLVIPPEERAQWELDGEAELRHILEAADNWFTAYQQYLEGDNRRNQARCCIAMPKLRQIVKEANQIHANLGNAAAKISRILAQAETWYEKHDDLLVRCGICDTRDFMQTEKPSGQVSLTEMADAVAEASSDISLDLEEALELERLLKRSEQWFDRALLAAPRRSKRNVRGKVTKSRFSLEDVISLVDEAHTLPIDTAADVERLRMQLNVVQTWRLQAHGDLGEVATAFAQLRDVVNASYGAPEHFLSDESRNMDTGGLSAEGGTVTPMEEDAMSVECPESVEDGISASEDISPSDSASYESSDQDTGVRSRLRKVSGISVHKMIEKLLKNARSTGVYTAEEKTAEVLQKASKWFSRSLKYIDSPKQMFEKKSFAVFDKFLVMGEGLVAQSKKEDDESDCKVDDVELVQKLNSNLGDLLSDQLTRLYALQSHRDQFIAWSDSVHQVLSSSEKRIPMETLARLFEQSKSYPAATDVVQKIRTLYQKATTWTEMTSALLNAEKKLSLHEAKERYDEGDKLNVGCDELKTLRNALRTVRGWATRVKRSKLDQGGAHITDLQELIQEHDSFPITMPDVIKKLNQAMRGYCLCRRPYDGFMIGCDDCDEWYHGPCIGVSESQAGRYEKYTCVRCCVAKVFKVSSASVVSLVRKWISPKDLKKARQIDWQKHQRKVRKEKRDIEKLEPEIERLEKLLEIRSNSAQNDSVEQGNLHTTVQSDASASGSHTGSMSADGTSHLPVEGTSEDKETLKDIVSADVQSDNNADLSQDHSTDGASHENESQMNATMDSGEKKDVPSEEDIQANLDKARAALQHCHGRLELLSQAALERKSFEEEEDKKSESLRNWCLNVCSSVIVPRVADQAQNSCPSLDGSMSNPMLATIKEAEALGISHLPDVASVTNGFGCISWSFRAMSVLSRKPKVAEANALVSQSSSVKLPEEKSVRMIKSMVQRASLWQVKVARALAPKPGESKPCCLDTLKELISGAGDIPMILPEETRLHNAIDDNGMRHCVCGGPSDGEFMLGCDKCERWFHGRCVNVCEKRGDTLRNWVCPPCGGAAPSDYSSLSFDQSEHDDQTSQASDCLSDDLAPHAPSPTELWPPYGLLNSPEALEAFGKECLDCMQVFLDACDKITDTDPLTSMKTEEISCNRESEREGRIFVDFNEKGPLVVSPELPATAMDVDKIEGKALKDNGFTAYAASCTDMSKNEHAALRNADGDGGNGAYMADKGQHPRMQASNTDKKFIDDGSMQTNADRIAITGRLDSATETGIVTESSVASVDGSDHNCQNKDDSSKACVQQMMEIDDSPARPIAARLVSNPALPGAYLGTIIHRQAATDSTVDQNDPSETEQQHVVQELHSSNRDLASVNARFASAVGSGVP